MKFINTIYIYFNIFLIFFGIIAYSLSYFQWSSHWLANMMMMSIPFVLLAFMPLTVLSLILHSKYRFLNLLMLAIGFPFIKSTFQFTWKNNEKVGLKILSYNVSSFHYDFQPKKVKQTTSLLKWTSKIDADIKCFQEYLEGDKKKMRLDINKMMSLKHPYHAFPKEPKSVTGYIGLATFSKYPIIHTIDSTFSVNKNAYLVTDIVVKRDTIRVINIHLWSMSIRFDSLTNEVKTDKFNKVLKESKNIINKLSKGFKERKFEIELIEKLIKSSPYPVILCGDFNEVPYCNSYQIVHKHLRNSFEKAGSGFGYTLNMFPYFVRIDNQFYSPDFELNYFETLKKVAYSDHFPLLGAYELKK